MVDGRIVGVWEIVDREVLVTPFPNGDRLSRDELEQEAAHVARASGLEQLTVRIG